MSFDDRREQSAIEMYVDFRNSNAAAPPWLDLTHAEREAWRHMAERAEERCSRRYKNKSKNQGWGDEP